MRKSPDNSASGGDSPDRASVPGRLWPAAAVGMSGAALIWLSTLAEDYLGMGAASNTYMPVPALVLAFLLGAGINPLLRRWRPSWCLGSGQLALAFTIMLTAGVLPSQPLVRNLPSLLASTCVEVRDRQDAARLFGELRLPAALFPDRLAYGSELPVAGPFVNGLEASEPIPWLAWLPPMLSWGWLLVSGFIFMVAIGLVVYPQWRNVERLAFPLRRVYNVAIEPPHDDAESKRVSRRVGFWVGAGVVFLLYLTIGLHAYFPEKCPAFPLRWNLSSAFAGPFLNQVPGYLKSGGIYFVLVGVGFLCPRRISFSIWFFALAVGLHMAIDKVYFPPYPWNAVDDWRVGTMLALTVSTLWVGRQHWARVGRAMVGPVRDAESRFQRFSGYALLLGAAGMFAWLLWIKVAPLWAVFFLLIGFAVCLVMARLVCETGMPFMRLYTCNPSKLLMHVPSAWFGPVAVYVTSIMDQMFHVASRASVTAFTTQSLALRGGSDPDSRTRRAFGILAALVAGLLLYGAATVYMGYRLPQTRGGASQGARAVGTVSNMRSVLDRYERGKYQPGWARMKVTRVGFGLALAGGLQWACLNVPKWPLHPIGMLLAREHYSNIAWPSMFLGWLLNVLIVRYGGAQLYRRAQTVFLGIIMGEVFATAFWRLIAYIVAACGQEFRSVGFLI